MSIGSRLAKHRAELRFCSIAADMQSLRGLRELRPIHQTIGQRYFGTGKFVNYVQPPDENRIIRDKRARECCIHITIVFRVRTTKFVLLNVWEFILPNDVIEYSINA